MFVAGESVYAALIFSILSFLVAVPSAVKVFNWTATMYKGAVSWETPMLYAYGFIGLFTIGGLTGLFLAAIGLDVHVTDTYFIVAHFHYIMVGGTIMGYLGGLHYWWPKISGRLYNEGLAKLSAGIIFIGFNLTFFPQFVVGYLGMPRRYHAYPPEFQVLNVLSSAGASILGVGYLIPMVYLMWSLRYGPQAGSNPWGAVGLEWTTTSPPPTENFAETPIVTWEPYEYTGAEWRVMLPEAVHATIRRRSLTSSTTWRSSAKPRRSGCGCFWSPKCSSSAACSSSTRCTASLYPAAFTAASHELDVMLGSINTVVLITSSLTMALAVRAAQTGQRRLLLLFLVATMVLGATFLGIKSVEYYHKFVEHHVPGPGFVFEAEHARHAQIFFSLYFVMTGLHAHPHDHRSRDHGGDAVVELARHDHSPSTTARSRSAACTGTSSISCGSSCSRCSTSSAAMASAAATQ